MELYSWRGGGGGGERGPGNQGDVFWRRTTLNQAPAVTQVEGVVVVVKRRGRRSE